MQGACTRLENALRTYFGWLVLRDVFYVCLGVGPTNCTRNFVIQAFQKCMIIPRPKLTLTMDDDPTAVEFFHEDEAQSSRKEEMINYLQGVVTSVETPARRGLPGAVGPKSSLPWR